MKVRRFAVGRGVCFSQASGHESVQVDIIGEIGDSTLVVVRVMRMKSVPKDGGPNTIPPPEGDGRGRKPLGQWEDPGAHWANLSEQRCSEEPPNECRELSLMVPSTEYFVGRRVLTPSHSQVHEC